MAFTKIDFNKKNILITGGAGFIGSNLAFYFQDNYPGCNVFVFDTFRSGEVFPNGNLKSFGHYKNLIGFKGEIICGNINNSDDLKLLEDTKFDFIFHQAAISDTRVYDQEAVMKTNINSFYWFLDKSKRDNANLIYASSAATYGSLSSPQSVGIENPENPYGYSKYAMDQIASKFLIQNPDVKIIGLRFFNVYGPREFFKDKTSSMVIQLAHQILKGNAPRLFEDSDQIYRDFIYIEDVIQANIKACNSAKSGVYNVGTGNQEVFRKLLIFSKKNYLLTMVPNILLTHTRATKCILKQIFLCLKSTLTLNLNSRLRKVLKHTFHISRKCIESQENNA